jgi:hypothetical protein
MPALKLCWMESYSPEMVYIYMIISRFMIEQEETLGAQSTAEADLVALAHASRELI